MYISIMMFDVLQPEAVIIIIYFSLFSLSLPLAVTVVVSSILHVKYILCNLNRVNN